MARNLRKLLADKATQDEPEIIRGQGYGFSTDPVPDAPPARTTPTSEEVTRQAPPATNRVSVRIRADLVKKCKLLAVQNDTTIAELIESFIERGLQEYK